MTAGNTDISPAGDYLTRAIENFHITASLTGDKVSRCFNISGKTVRFEIATAAMDRLITRGIAHLAIESAGQADLTVYAWDSESALTQPLRAAWGKDAYDNYGHIAGFNDARFHAAVQVDPHLLCLIDFEQHIAVYWMPSAHDLPVWEAGAPARPLLHKWLQHLGFVPVHGGAVGTPDGGIFLAGAGGSGKSNLALSSLTSPLFYASDDFSVLSEPPWTVHSLYCTGKIAAEDMIRHPHLRGLESNPDRLDKEKALFFLHEHFPGKLIQSMPLKAIVLPRIVEGKASELVPTSPAAAQKAIALSTIQMSRAMAGFTFQRVAEFVRALPSFELRIGAQAETAAPVMDLLTDLL